MNTNNLWAPWRMAYLRDMQCKEDQLAASGSSSSALAHHSPAGSFLADYFQHPEHDERNLVVYRNESGLILLNRYPYANGHLMTALGEPRPTLLDYDEHQRAAFWRLVDIATELVTRTLNPQGVNMGVNQGRAAGAGLPEHLHAHIIPRWSGDTNFITVIGNIRVIPDALESMAAQYRAAITHLTL